jgi:hypothetical protein
MRYVVTARLMSARLGRRRLLAEAVAYCAIEFQID